MKKLLMIIVGLFVMMAANAQTSDHMSRLTLKDGLEMVGYLTEQEDGNYLLQTAAGDVFYYFGHEVTKIKEVPNVGKRKGWMGIASLGAEVIFIGATAKVAYGYRFSPHFFMGLETGFVALGPWDRDDYYYEYDYYYHRSPYEGNGFSIPIGLYIMSEFSKRQTSMYASLAGGVNRNTDSGYQSPYLDVTIGFRKRMKDPNHAMWYGLGLALYHDPLPVLKVSYSF